MSVKGFKFNDTVNKYDYNELDNKPTPDATLTKTGQAADAKAVGDQLSTLKEDIIHINGLSDAAKTALLACFRNVAWINDQGDAYYNALEAALDTDSYPKITAEFYAGANTIYTDDALDSLKQYLTIKYFATKDSTGTVVADNDYTLSGILVEGTSIITVMYDGLRANISIPRVVDFYNIWEWSISEGNLSLMVGTTDYYGTTQVPTKYTYADTTTTNDVVPYRRTPRISKGLVPYRLWGSNDPVNPTMTPYYPMPIPKNANKVTISITPNTQYIYAHILKVVDNDVTRILQQGWVQGTNEITFTADENLVLMFNCKYDSTGRSYPVEPTDVHVIFEEV